MFETLKFYWLDEDLKKIGLWHCLHVGTVYMLGAETLAEPDQFHLPTLYVDPISPILMLLKVTLVVGSLASILQKLNVSDS